MAKGLEIVMSCRDLVIPADKVSQALRAINGLYTPEIYAKSSLRRLDPKWPHKEKRFAYCRPAPEGGWQSITEAINAWRFTPHVRQDGSVQILGFQASHQGDEEFFIQAVGDLLAPGGQIVTRDLHDRYIRYCFTGQQVKRSVGRVVWAEFDWDLDQAPMADEVE